MKTLRNRNTVKISVTSYQELRDDIYKQALEDGVRQGVAACLLCLNMNYGWKKQRLQRFASGAEGVLSLPDVLGKQIDGGLVCDYLKETFDIDIDKIHLEVVL